MKRRNWTEREQAIACTIYATMLEIELRGGKVNKAKICREILPLLDNRSRGSYEMKMMNISAAMLSLGFPHIRGYKPYGHAQKSLADTMLQVLTATPQCVAHVLAARKRAA